MKPGRRADPPLPPRLTHALRAGLHLYRRKIITFNECTRAVEGLTRGRPQPFNKRKRH